MVEGKLAGIQQGPQQIFDGFRVRSRASGSHAARSAAVAGRESARRYSSSMIAPPESPRPCSAFDAAAQLVVDRRAVDEVQRLRETAAGPACGLAAPLARTAAQHIQRVRRRLRPDELHGARPGGVIGKLIRHAGDLRDRIREHLRGQRLEAGVGEEPLIAAVRRRGARRELIGARLRDLAHEPAEIETVLPRNSRPARRATRG